MNKFIPLLLSAFILTGCNVEDIVNEPENDPNDDQQTTTDTTTTVDVSKLTSVVLIELLNGSGIPLAAQIKDKKAEAMTYLNRNEAGLVSDIDVEKVGATDNGMDNYLWTVGSSKYAGECTFTFSKSIKYVSLKLSSHQKVHDGTATAFTSYGTITFDGVTTEHFMPAFTTAGEYNYVDVVKTSVNGTTTLTIKSLDSKADVNDYRVAVHNLTVAY